MIKKILFSALLISPTIFGQARMQFLVPEAAQGPEKVEKVANIDSNWAKHSKETRGGRPVTRESLFFEDARYKGTLALSDYEINTKIEESIKKSRHSRNITPSALTAKIMWAAECTGNDPFVLAAILEHESYYCSALKAGNGGEDSGCGQIVSKTVVQFKELLGYQGNKSKESKNNFKEMIRGCEASNGAGLVTLDGVKKLLRKSNLEVLKSFRRGDNFSMEIMLSAINLKIKYAVFAGGVYYDNSKHKRAVSHYNGGAGYSGLVWPKVCELNPDIDYCGKSL